MAKDVSFKISAIDDFSKTFEKIEGGFSKVEKAGEKIGKVGKDLTTKVTAPIVGMATGVALVGAKFDESMSKVQAISGATGEDLTKLRNTAKEMGATTQFSASQSAEALQYMALAGWNTEQMVSALPGVLDLAAAGALDLALASDIVTDTMSMFGMSADQASKAADVFAKAQATSNTDVQQLGEALKYVGATANAVGMDIEQTSAILGVFANNGIKGSSAGTALDAMFRDLKKSVEDGNITIGDTSVAVYDVSGAMRSMTDIMADVENATNGMDDATRDAALSNIFQSQALRGVNILLGEGTDAIYELEKGLYASNGAAGEMADVMNDNVMGAFREMKSALEGAAIAMYEILQPAISETIAKITEWIKWFMDLDESTQKNILKIVALVAAIGPALVIIGKLIALVKTIIIVAKAFGVVLAFLTSPIGLVVAAVVGLIAIGVLLWKNWDVIKEKAGQLWSKLTEIFNRIKAVIGEKITEASEKIKETFNSILSFITGLGTTFYNAGKGLIDQMINGIKNMASKAVDAVKGVAQKVRNLLPFSPAKDGPLSDLNKLDFGGPITDSIARGLPKVRASMSHILEVPKMNVKPINTDKSSAKAIQTQSPTTNDNRVYITVEGNIDSDLYDDITRRMARNGDTKLRVNGVKR